MTTISHRLVGTISNAIPKEKADRQSPFDLGRKITETRKPAYTHAQFTPDGVLLLHARHPLSGAVTQKAIRLSERQISEIKRSHPDLDLRPRMSNSFANFVFLIQAQQGMSITNECLLGDKPKESITDIDRYKAVRDYILQRGPRYLSAAEILRQEYYKVEQCKPGINYIESQKRKDLFLKLLAADLLLMYTKDLKRDDSWLFDFLFYNHMDSSKSPTRKERHYSRTAPTIIEMLRKEFLSEGNPLSNYFSSEEKLEIRQKLEI